MRALIAIIVAVICGIVPFATRVDAQESTFGPQPLPPAPGETHSDAQASPPEPEASRNFGISYQSTDTPSQSSAATASPQWAPQVVDNSSIFSGQLLATDSEPDISKPGPDMGDFPNSAYTLKKGRAYVEFAPMTYQTADGQNSASYNAPFLLRYGVTDNVEFRLIGSGLTIAYDPGNTISGISPLILDTKVHLWDDQIKRMIPAASLEVYVQTNWGSPAFQGGVQPSLNLNLDFPFTEKTNLEMTFGYTGVQDAFSLLDGSRIIPRFGHRIHGIHLPGVDVNQFSYQWAIEQQVTEKFQVFLHGYYNGPILFTSGPGSVVGMGYFYQFTKRSTIFNSFNAAIDKNAPPFSTQIGLAFAY